MTQLSFDLDPRAIGQAAAEHCTANAEIIAAFDKEGAAMFILGWLRRHGPMSGELLTDAAKQHGYRGHDDRCFGSVFAKLSRGGWIRFAGYTTRAKGHGTGGARIWAAVQ